MSEEGLPTKPTPVNGADPDPHITTTTTSTTTAYPSPPLPTMSSSNTTTTTTTTTTLPTPLLTDLTPLLNRFPSVHMSISPSPLQREARIRFLNETTLPDDRFGPSVKALADFYARTGTTLPSRDTYVIAAGDMIFHGTAPDLRYFLGVWLRMVGEEVLRERYPVVDMVWNPGAEGSGE